MDNKEEETEFKEEIVILDRPVLKNQPRKLNSKIIGKKTVLRKGGLRASPPPIQKEPKKSNAEFLMDTIVKTFWTAKWKEQITIMKFSRVGYNRKRADFRTLCMKLNRSMKYHQYLYLTKLFDNMEKMPMKPGVKHDENYGKIKLVSRNNQKMNNNENIIIEDNQNNPNIREDKIDSNIINDGNIQITIDIPKIVEVEFNQEKELEIGKDNNKDNIIIEEKMDIEPESPPQLIDLKKKEKKIIKRKNKNNDDNNDNANIDKNNEMKSIDNKDNNDKSNHFLEKLRKTIENIIKESVNENKIIIENDINSHNNEKINKDDNKIEIKEEIVESIKIEEKKESNKPKDDLNINQENQEDIINTQNPPQNIMEIKIEKEEGISNEPNEKKVEKLNDETGLDLEEEPKIKIKGNKKSLTRKIKRLKEKMVEDKNLNQENK